MPKLTKQQLKDVRYVSLSDFSSRIDQIEEIEDKVAFATAYLLSHGVGETDCSFLEAVHVARMKVAEASLESKNKLYNDDVLDIDPADYPIDENPCIVNAFVEDEKNDRENEMFMGNPIAYLRGKARDRAAEIEDQDMESSQESALKENCLRLDQELASKTMKDMIKVDKDSQGLDIKLRLEKKFPNRNIAKETKTGFFSAMFGGSSKAWANLDTVYKAFGNPNHVLYGDIEALEKAANDYLMHRFPQWKPGQPLPPKEDIARLSGTKKPRTELSVAVIEAVGEHKKVFSHFGMLVEKNMKQNLRYEDLEKPEGNEYQANFQKKLELDLSADDASIEEDEPESSKVHEKAKDNVDESLDMSDDMSAD